MSTYVHLRPPLATTSNPQAQPLSVTHWSLKRVDSIHKVLIIGSVQRAKGLKAINENHYQLGAIPYETQQPPSH